MSENKISEVLQGKTLAVYFFLLGHNEPISARELQRTLGISSPSLALYHLKKLEELDLIEMDRESGFQVRKSVRVGVLRFFVGTGRLHLPRYIFYSLFAVSYFIGALLFMGWPFTPHFILFLFFSAFTILVFCYETANVWKSRPII